MKMIFALSLIISSVIASNVAVADSIPFDNLSYLSNNGGARELCNLSIRSRGSSATSTSCEVNIVMLDTIAHLDEIAAGKFGHVDAQLRILKDVNKVLVWRKDHAETQLLPEHSSILMLDTIMTVDQIESIRFEPTIYGITPSLPLGPTGGVTSAGGGN